MTKPPPCRYSSAGNPGSVEGAYSRAASGVPSAAGMRRSSTRASCARGSSRISDAAVYALRASGTLRR